MFKATLFFFILIPVIGFGQNKSAFQINIDFTTNLIQKTSKVVSIKNRLNPEFRISLGLNRKLTKKDRIVLDFTSMLTRSYIFIGESTFPIQYGTGKTADVFHESIVIFIGPRLSYNHNFGKYNIFGSFLLLDDITGFTRFIAFEESKIIDSGKYTNNLFIPIENLKYLLGIGITRKIGPKMNIKFEYNYNLGTLNKENSNPFSSQLILGLIYDFNR